MSRIRVLIADDHAMVRAGLRALLAAQSDMEVVGEATDGVDVVEECRRRGPDVVLMDLTMPGRGGIAAIEDLRQSCPSARALVVTMHEDEAYARQAMLAGACGYVLKQALASDLINAVRDVHRGRRPLPASLATAVDEPAAAPARPAAHKAPGESLSPREREVVGLIAMGLTTAEIARRLHIGDKTVETHRMHISGKLALRSRAELVRFAIEHGLLAV